MRYLMEEILGVPEKCMASIGIGGNGAIQNMMHIKHEIKLTGLCFEERHSF